MCQGRHGETVQAYLLIVHLPIRLVTKAQHFPHYNPKAPHITGCGEDPMGNSFWGCPTDGDLSSLGRHGTDEYKTMWKGDQVLCLCTDQQIGYICECGWGSNLGFVGAIKVIQEAS